MLRYVGEYDINFVDNLYLLSSGARSLQIGQDFTTITVIDLMRSGFYATRCSTTNNNDLALYRVK